MSLAISGAGLFRMFSWFLWLFYRVLAKFIKKIFKKFFVQNFKWRQVTSLSIFDLICSSRNEFLIAKKLFNGNIWQSSGMKWKGMKTKGLTGAKIQPCEKTPQSNAVTASYRFDLKELPIVISSYVKVWLINLDVCRNCPNISKSRTLDSPLRQKGNIFLGYFLIITLMTSVPCLMLQIQTTALKPKHGRLDVTVIVVLAFFTLIVV